MQIKSRLLIVLLSISLIPMCIVALLSGDTARSVLTRKIGDGFHGIALEKAEAISRILSDRVIEAQLLARHPVLVDAVRTANALHPAEGLNALIRERDLEWIANKRQTPTADACLHNPAASFLKDYQQRDSSRYGEIFVTDHHGATVAMTKRLSDYYQADEEWWSGGYNEGHGGIFLDDRGFDASIQSIALGAVAPIFDGDELIGILKINYRVKDILNIVNSTPLGESSRVYLARSSRDLVVSSEENGNERALDLDRLAPGEREQGWVVESGKIVGYASITAELQSRVLPPGAIKGVSGERWVPLTWNIFVELDQEEAFQDLMQMLRQLLYIGVMVFGLAFVIAWWLARSVAAPLSTLRYGTKIIGAGNLDHKVGIDSKDEIGDLSRAFDSMTERLKSVTASREALRHEIAAREKAEKQLVASNKELQHFAYVVSHDMQEPLRMVSSYLGLIVRRYQGQLDSDADEFIGFAVDGANRMSNMIDGMLLFSRVHTEGESFEQVDMEDVLTEALENLAVSIKEAGAEIDQPPLPSVEADRPQIIRLLQNLISNAIKFCMETPRIRVSAERQGDEWVFAVQDNGIGISEADHKRIFMIFQRLHEQSDYPGSGIGLAVCKRIVERHGGRIWLDSSKGKGTTFFFSLPA